MEETKNYIKYHTLCPIPLDCEALVQENEVNGKILLGSDKLSQTVLDLSSQNLEDISFLRDYGNLKVLSLKRNKIKDISVLANLTQLEDLDLSYNQIVDFSPLENLKHLKKIAPQKLNKYLCVETDGPETELQLEKIKNDWYKKIKNPKIEKYGFIFKKTSVTWNCITFGSYPQTKVSPMKQEVRNKLVQDKNCEFIYTYRTASGQVEKYYKKAGDYYKFEPICWRVLQIKKGTALLFANKVLNAIYLGLNDAESFNFEKSSASQYLNSDIKYGVTKDVNCMTFLNMAFSKKEKEAMIQSESRFVSLLAFSAISDVKYSSYGLFSLYAKGKLSIEPSKARNYTDFAKANYLTCSTKLLPTGEIEGTTSWWLKDINSMNVGLGDRKYGYAVEATGKINPYKSDIRTGMRPVIEVDLSMLDKNDVQISTVTV